ncbi:hypothetical protein RCL1_001461 [Eukaryota sp. TZLM3-RCL]
MYPSQSTVITGPQGSSGSPVPPRTPPRGDTASPKEAPVPAPMEPGTPLPPSRRDSASPKEVPVSAPMEPGTPLPPYHGSPSPAPEEQQGSSNPSREQSPSVSLPSSGNEDDPHLPRPIIIPSVDSELQLSLELVSRQQSLESSSSAPSSSQPSLLEDERIQSVLNRLHDYASFHRIPLDALFGPEYRKSTPRAPPKDPKVIRANPPPAVPRPSSLDGNLRHFPAVPCP